jgi:hypothetical protein
MVSAYEQERLDNIAPNEAFLDAIGLGNGKPGLIAKNNKKWSYDTDYGDDQQPIAPIRKSARVATLEPEHGQLTDEFYIAEEHGLLRSKRDKSAPAKAYSEIQAEEDTARREASLQRAAAKRKLMEDAERKRTQE